MLKVSYSGIEGAFAHEAAKKMFPDALHVSSANFEQAYQKAYQGECDIAVLPIENSYAGAVEEVKKMLSRGEMEIISKMSLPIVQNLLGVRGSRINDIKTVVSQKKAIEQCDTYIRKNGYEIIEAVNTAVAARQVVSEGKMAVAAIASLETAALYGLKVLDEHINEKDDNITTFVAVSRNIK